MKCSLAFGSMVVVQETVELDTWNWCEDILSTLLHNTGEILFKSAIINMALLQKFGDKISVHKVCTQVSRVSFSHNTQPVQKAGRRHTDVRLRAAFFSCPVVLSVTQCDRPANFCDVSDNNGTIGSRSNHDNDRSRTNYNNEDNSHT
jgi:hypothetical protein